MSLSYERFQKKRLLTSYASVVLSIFLVLFLLGTLGVFVINTEKVSNAFKENIPMSVYFQDDVSDQQLADFQTDFQDKVYIKDITFVHKDSAAKEHQATIGENFVHFLGYNPLQHSYDIHLKGGYVQSDSIKSIAIDLKEFPNVDEVIYDQQLVDLVNDNIEKVSFWVLVVALFFLGIAMLLINSSLRLSVYSNRFIIKTMQMVGATKSFIRRPFIWRSIRLGLIGASLAIIAVLALTYRVDQQLPDLGLMKDTKSLLIVCGGILFLGVFITWVSTYFATQRYLNLHTDDLY